MMKLNDWQKEDTQTLINWGGGIAGHEMGTGKTAIAIEFLKVGKGVVLVILPVVAIGIWIDELSKWAPELTVIIIHKNAPKILHDFKNIWATHDVILTTYDTVVRNRDVFNKVKYKVLVCDEAHRLKNRNTLRFRSIKSMRKQIQSVLLLSGTIARKGPQDLWTLLHLIKPQEFSSYWKFANTYCEIIDGVFGREIVGPKNMSSLRLRLERDFMVRRTKEQVLPSLPPKIRQVIKINTDKEQNKIYDALVDDAILRLGSGKLLITPSQLTLILRLRQLLVCPKLLDKDCNSYGAGLNTIFELWSDGDKLPSVIFTPFPSTARWVKEFLEGQGEYRYTHLISGLPAEEAKSVIEEFKLKGGFLLASIKGAESYNLSFCSICYFLGCEWSPDENSQAEDRLHRRTSQNTVNSYFLRHKGTIEESVAMTLDEKTRNVYSILKTFDDIRRKIN